MGKAVIHAGGSGAGQAAKICNNMMLGATMVATCEAFAAREEARARSAEILRHRQRVSSGQSWSMTSYCPVPASAPKRRPTMIIRAASREALMLKDLQRLLPAPLDRAADAHRLAIFRHRAPRDVEALGVEQFDQRVVGEDRLGSSADQRAIALFTASAETASPPSDDWIALVKKYLSSNSPRAQLRYLLLSPG
jgi:3-hydroxyisobutyrate dehydrogenase-like beta-hydroxyacid dehydrogenase